MTVGVNGVVVSNKFQLTRPLWGVTQAMTSSEITLTISTHTPLVGRDQALEEWIKHPTISTHTPLVGRDCILKK